MAYVVMAYVVTAYIVMAYNYIGHNYIVMAEGATTNPEGVAIGEVSMMMRL